MVYFGGPSEFGGGGCLNLPPLGTPLPSQEPFPSPSVPMSCFPSFSVPFGLLSSSSSLHLPS